jgi:hypothetical protein
MDAGAIDSASAAYGSRCGAGPTQSVRLVAVSRPRLGRRDDAEVSSPASWFGKIRTVMRRRLYPPFGIIP